MTTSNFEKRKKKLSKEAIASSRTKRMKTKILKKYGFFCDEFIQRELNERPSYYQGYLEYHFDEMEDYCERMEKQLTPPEVLGILVTKGIPPENTQLKVLQARREMMMQKARERILSPEYKARMEARKQELLEQKKAEMRWLMRADRDEDSLFAHPVTQVEK